MYQCSDSESKDSDDGVRFKTESVRNKKIPKSGSIESVSRKRSSPRSSEKYKSRHNRDERSRQNRRRNSNSSSSENEYKQKERSQKDKHKRSSKKEDSIDEHKLDSKVKSSYNRKPATKKKGDEKSAKEKSISSKGSVTVVGRSLPPNLIKSKVREEDKQSTIQEGTNSNFGPAIPVHLLKQSKNIEDVKDTNFVGPTLPPLIIKSTSHIESIQDNDNESASIGPALPPHIKSNKLEKSLVMAPKLPHYISSDQEISKPHISHTSVCPNLLPHMSDSKEELSLRTISTSDIESRVPIEVTEEYKPIVPKVPEDTSGKFGESDIRTIGPALPSHLRELLAESSVQNDENSDDEEAFGPLPVGQTKLTSAQLALEERALQMRMDQLNPKKDEPTRESWMLELPETTKKFGLGPRQFRAKAGPDLSDRSVWTDTPMDKAKKRQGKAEEKVDLKKESELKEMRRRDKEQEAMSKKQKKSKESLFDSHQKKLKNEKSDGPTERRPFNRETDLQVNKFDEAQKKAILKKAQLLDDRFSSGHSKFL